MGEIMADIREKTIDTIGGMKVTAKRDYSTGVIKYADGSEGVTGLPASNMLYFELEGGSAVIVRPSGTEPKIKAYILVRAESDNDADVKIGSCTEDCKKLLCK
jgi:phosphoglucomutase